MGDHKPQSNKWQQLRLAAAVGGLVFLAGCAITPVSVTDEERAGRVEADRLALFKDQEPVTGSISLGEALVRAIMYNLDNRVKFMELAVAQRNLDFSNKAMFPQLVASAGYGDRSNQPGARSVDVDTGAETLPPSTSREEKTETADLVFSWNLLDFGLSYHSAHQRADEVLIAQERQRKTIQNITQDVVDAYWKAWIAQNMQADVDKLISDTDAALEQSRNLANSQAQSKREALSYQVSLMRIRNSLYELQERMGLSKIRLAALINVPPNAEITLEQPIEQFEAAEITRSYDSLVDNALLLRPELQEEDYRRRITVREVKKSMLRLLPIVSFSAGYYTDQNEFLINDDWNAYDINISWDILGLFSANAEKKFREAQVELADARRLALTMAVMTQVRLSLERYNLARNKYNSSKEMSGLSEEYAAVINSSTQDSDLDKIRANTESILSNVRSYYDFAETQSAYARVLNSIGLDILPNQFEGGTVAEMGDEVVEKWQRIYTNYL